MNPSDFRDTVQHYPTPEALDPSDLAGRATQLATRRRRTQVVGAAACGVGLLATGVWVGGSLRHPAHPTTAPAASPTVSSTTSGTPTATPTHAPTKTPTATVTTPPPVGVIPPRTWVKVAPSSWFVTFGTIWCRADQAARPSHLPTQSEIDGRYTCRATVGNTNLGSTGLSNVQGGSAGAQELDSSVFTGTPVSTTLKVKGHTYQGRLWRLQGIPGWNLGVWMSPAGTGIPFESAEFDTYDSSGKVRGRFVIPGLKNWPPTSAASTPTPRR